jgi:ABC-2 type transport system permease protein
MSQMHLVRIIARREFVMRVKSKAFLVAMGVTVLLLVGFIVVPTLGGDDTDTIKIGVLAGQAEQLQAAVEQIPGTVGGDMADDVIEFTSFDSQKAAEQALSDGDIQVLLTGDNEVTLNRSGFFSSSRVPGIVTVAAQVLRLQEASVASGLPVEELVSLTQSPLEIAVLEGEGSDPIRTIIAYIGMMATYMAILLYGSWTLSGVVEEKASKVVETIVSTLRPRYLLAGKVIGIGGLAILQMSVFATAGVIAVKATGALDNLGAASQGLPNDSLAMLALWFVVGFFLYNTLFAAAGALINRIDDAQMANMPLALVAIASILASSAALGDPTGTTAQVATYFPLSAPFVVPIRYALKAIEGWEIALSLILTLSFAVLAIRAAGRIYEGAILRSGGRVKLREAWRGDS